jgi:hypothetical protein
LVYSGVGLLSFAYFFFQVSIIKSLKNIQRCDNYHHAAQIRFDSSFKAIIAGSLSYGVLRLSAVPETILNKNIGMWLITANFALSDYIFYSWVTDIIVSNRAENNYQSIHISSRKHFANVILMILALALRNLPVLTHDPSTADSTPIDGGYIEFLLVMIRSYFVGQTTANEDIKEVIKGYNPFGLLSCTRPSNRQVQGLAQPLIEQPQGGANLV